MSLVRARRAVSLTTLACTAALACGACTASGHRREPDGPDSGVGIDTDTGVPPRFGDAGARGPTLETLLGPDVTAADPPPAISGGTLLVTHDDRFAIVADPDRDRIVVVDLVTRELDGVLALSLHDEPGRLAEDGAGHVHVALRRGGAVVSFDPATQTVLARRAVCTAPRGIAYEAAHDVLHVACAGGELVTLPAADGAPTRTLRLDRDLRDVVVDGDTLYVSRFRSAEVLALDAAGTVTQRFSSPAAVDPTDGMAMTSASVAWRMIPGPTGGVLLLHQRGRSTPIITSAPSGYGGFDSCRSGDSIVHAAVTPISLGATAPATPVLGCVVLGVDVALSPDGSELIVAAAGNAPIEQDAQLQRFATAPATSPPAFPEASVQFGVRFDSTGGRVVAVAYDSAGGVLAQTREPATLIVTDALGRSVVDLGGASRDDTGHTIFHASSGGGLACASCHPEGGEDGRVWTFEGIGTRRTQSLGRGILGTEPFHWSGDMPTFDHLMSDVFGMRMSGGELSPSRVAATAHWVDGQPGMPALEPADAAAVERGRVLFDDEIVGCATCHAGPHLTTSETVDVGTGGLFQVPSLHGVAWRAPYLHDGCAATLRDRFGACGGGEMHGRTDDLDAAAIGDLIAYLETL